MKRRELVRAKHREWSHKTQTPLNFSNINLKSSLSSLDFPEHLTMDYVRYLSSDIKSCIQLRTQPRFSRGIIKSRGENHSTGRRWMNVIAWNGLQSSPAPFVLILMHFRYQPQTPHSTMPAFAASLGKLNYSVFNYSPEISTKIISGEIS